MYIRNTKFPDFLSKRAEYWIHWIARPLAPECKCHLWLYTFTHSYILPHQNNIVPDWRTNNNKTGDSYAGIIVLSSKTGPNSIVISLNKIICPIDIYIMTLKKENLVFQPKSNENSQWLLDLERFDRDGAYCF
jgi:hypothetical protein